VIFCPVSLALFSTVGTITVVAKRLIAIVAKHPESGRETFSSHPFHYMPAFNLKLMLVASSINVVKRKKFGMVLSTTGTLPAVMFQHH